MNKKLSALILSCLMAATFDISTVQAVRLANTAPEPATIETVEPATAPVESVKPDEDINKIDVKDFLAQMAGHWYDVRNYQIITVASGDVPGINGCPIVSFTSKGDLAKGSAIVELRESGDTKKLNLEWEMDENIPLDSCIKVNGMPTYRHTDENSYTASILGFHLWMTEGEVRSRASDPGEYWDADTTYSKIGLRQDAWYFEDGIIFTYSPKSKILDRIIILDRCDIPLDGSNLTASSSPEDFAKHYHWGKTPLNGDVMKIDDDEYLSFKHYPEAIVLTVYDK